MHQTRASRCSLALAAAALAAPSALIVVDAIVPRTARACGGFFCGQSPVDQKAERIIFTTNADGTTDMIVQITFQGASSDFAWVLPLGAVPDRASLTTFPQRALVGLDAQTGPSFVYPEDCWGRGGLEDADFGSGPPGPSPTAGGGVTVHIREEVGPYDVAVIEDRDPTALVTWLRDNGYRVMAPMEPYIALYAAEGQKFLALKLLPEAGTSDVAPFRMRLPGSAPGIPIRLTAIAAEPEMGIAVFILGDMRYAGANWDDVTVDDAELAWSNQTWPIQTNWTALVARAVDAVGGRGWVTEYAGSTASYLELLRSSRPADAETQEATEALLDLMGPHSYLTRLYTRLSPEEMTVDPIFRPDGGGDVARDRMLPRFVGGVDMCAGSPDSDACAFAACGRGGLCRVIDGEGGAPDTAGCACVPGASARTTTDPEGDATVTCVDMSMSFLNPGDRETPTSAPLPDPCVGFDCGMGRCVAQNMTPTCVCEQGAVAIGSFGSDGARSTRCLLPRVPVPASFYDLRLPIREASLPAGRVLDVPPPPRAAHGRGGCAATGPRDLGAVAPLLFLLAIGVRRRRR